MTSPTFSAALLAGGKSTRMGRDKAFLSLPGTDLLLWEQQWRLLEELLPEEILWSGPSRPELPANIRVIPDTVLSAGPLSGLSACLEVLSTDLLVVLAVDLPQMTSAFLRNLLIRSTVNCGTIVRHGDFFEPLAAVYPRQLRALVSTHLVQGRYAMQDLVREGVKQRLLQEFSLDPNDAALFKNVNSPPDLAELPQPLT